MRNNFFFSEIANKWQKDKLQLSSELMKSIKKLQQNFICDANDCLRSTSLQAWECSVTESEEKKNVQLPVCIFEFNGILHCEANITKKKKPNDTV